MARVSGLMEKVHYLLFDTFYVPPPSGQAPYFLIDHMSDRRIIRLFTDVQGKTKLETNLQAPSTLPSKNSFELHAVRIAVNAQQAVFDPNFVDGNVLPALPAGAVPAAGSAPERPGGVPAVGLNARNFLHALCFNSVLSLIVGEKVMWDAISFWHTTGAGVNPADNALPQFGEANPLATSRLSEPIYIEPHQTFRVEMQFPRQVPYVVAHVRGPVWIWCILDGYLVRDVQ